MVCRRREGSRPADRADDEPLAGSVGSHSGGDSGYLARTLVFPAPKTLLIDHFVTVLEVTDKEVTVGDPLNGKTTLGCDAFKNKWRFSGVVLKRNPKP